jgi:hypothetical protein
MEDGKWKVENGKWNIGTGSSGVDFQSACRKAIMDCAFGAGGLEIRPTDSSCTL